MASASRVRRAAAAQKRPAQSTQSAQWARQVSRSGAKVGGRIIGRRSPQAARAHESTEGRHHPLGLARRGGGIHARVVVLVVLVALVALRAELGIEVELARRLEDARARPPLLLVRKVETGLLRGRVGGGMPCSTWLGSVSGLGLGLRVGSRFGRRARPCPCQSPRSSTRPRPTRASPCPSSARRRPPAPRARHAWAPHPGCIGPSGGHPAPASPGPARLALGWSGLG